MVIWRNKFCKNNNKRILLEFFTGVLVQGNKPKIIQRGQFNTLEME